MAADIMLCLPVLEGDALPPVPEGLPGYKMCLQMAGATVLAFREFGAYQGDWWALVQVGEVTAWVKGSYGSCSGCDAFQAEFDYDDDERPDYARRLASFGRQYLEFLYSQKAAEKEAAENIEWDHDAEEMLAWIKSFRGKGAAMMPTQIRGKSVER